MGRKYAHPPVVEAVCEFRLSPDSPWDMTVPGLVYEKLKDAFPIKEQRWIQEIQLAQSPEGLQQEIRTSERVLFFAENKKTFVQVGPRLLAVNSLRPYPSWKTFKALIAKAFESLTEVTEVTALERLGLRYINQVEIPASVRELNKYFRFYLSLGEGFPGDVERFVAGCEFPSANLRDSCRVQLTPAVSSSPQNLRLMLDIDYFMAKPKGVGPQHAMEWVENAHSKVVDVFEACITDRSRELWAEVTVTS